MRARGIGSVGQAETRRDGTGRDGAGRGGAGGALCSHYKEPRFEFYSECDGVN